MNLKELDLFHLTKLTSQQVDHVTCDECCKYYIAPETAGCGHSLCHSCWRGRRACPACAAPLERKALKLNLPLQNLTEHVHALAEAVETLFNIKLDEFILDETENEIQNKTDPTKNVKDWLASSQNQFSAPIINSEPFSQEISNPVQLSTSKIQVHLNSKKSESPNKVVYVPPPQDDWDKIEQLPDTEEIISVNKENLSNQSNQQPCYLIGDEYTMENQRRSSRKRVYNSQNEASKLEDQILEKPSSKNSSCENEKKSNKTKQNWNNVKRMRKEFSKLNKKNKSKLNVSIEMCKKTQGTTNKTNIDTEPKMIDKDSQPILYTIEDNTPGIDNNPEQINAADLVPNETVINEKENNVMKSSDAMSGEVNADNNKINDVVDSSMQQNENNGLQSSIQSKVVVSDKNATNIDKSTNTKVPFIKKFDLCHDCSEKNKGFNLNNNPTLAGSNLDDIEITFKIGNTLTNITIKRKNNDVQLRVKTDREVQTSLGSNNLESRNSNYDVLDGNPQEININVESNKTVSATRVGNDIVKSVTDHGVLNKSNSSKKNTASADTATAQFEITESVEKELSNSMDCIVTVDNKNQKQVNNNIQSQKNPTNLCNDNENCENYDLDIFENESVQEPQVQLLNKSKHASSEILMTTVKTRTQKHPDKRDRDRNDDDDIPHAKKFKPVVENTQITEKSLCVESTLQPSHKENDSINYDLVMGQVFASIDADIERSQRSTKYKQANNSKAINAQQSQNILDQTQKSSQVYLSTHKVTKTKENVNDKCSENVFSNIAKDDETDEFGKKGDDDNGSTQQHIENLLTPIMCEELINKEQCTPFNVQDDSDKSVVEETPQKNVSFPKPKIVSDVNNELQKGNWSVSKVSSPQHVKSIINVSDTLADSTKTGNDRTVLEVVAKKQNLETPLTINKFVDQIKHKSTPVARKSLNFDSENVERDDDDPERTLCPSSIVAKTTQEKEFMAKAFEQTPTSPVNKPLARNVKEVDLKYCIAGSCLSAVELANVKVLCRKYNWKYVDKYTKELTHLVVGVDEENRSQRSVKYMCALAASKWIVSYEWVNACITTNLVVTESLYEALDGTGEPGPKRSRLAKTKLFEGIIFHCMPPFSVLDVDTLQDMLEAAGGRVVATAAEAAAAPGAPALLLAEPEHTQENRFMYLALELKIVPVNYEWVLNCLGSYALSSLHELLLCPAALLPPATSSWPDALIARDSC